MLLKTRFLIGIFLATTCFAAPPLSPVKKMPQEELDADIAEEAAVSKEEGATNSSATLLPTDIAALRQEAKKLSNAYVKDGAKDLQNRYNDNGSSLSNAEEAKLEQYQAALTLNGTTPGSDAEKKAAEDYAATKKKHGFAKTKKGLKNKAPTENSETSDALDNPLKEVK